MSDLDPAIIVVGEAPAPEAAPAPAAAPSTEVARTGDDPSDWPDGTFLELDGARFRLADRLAHMAIMEFAKVAERGASAGSLEGFTALFDLIRSVIDDRDWQRFRDHCNAMRYDDAEITQIATDAMEAITKRPPVSPSDSPGGQASTTQSSNGTSGGADSRPKRNGKRSGDDPQRRARLDAMGIHPIGHG